MKRRANYELLRIIAMVMIITLHYLDKGNVLISTQSALQADDYLKWLLEAFCIISVNIYVLLSGMLGYEKKGFKIRKLVLFWIQVVTYSLLITAIAYLSGITAAGSLTKYDILNKILPISSEEYWFATSFFILMLLIPLLNEGIRVLPQKQFCCLLFGLLIVNSFIYSMVPVQFPYDHNGYDPFWFITLYLCGAYIGKYGFHFCTTRLRSILVLALSVLGIWSLMLVLNQLFLKTGRLSEWINHSYSYNFILTLTGAIGLIGLFQFVEIREGKLAQLIRFVASCTFGVYLIHEHPALRYKWPQWFAVSTYADSGFMILHLIGTVLVVFILCTIIEAIRKKIMSFIIKQ